MTDRLIAMACQTDMSTSIYGYTGIQVITSCKLSMGIF